MSNSSLTIPEHRRKGFSAIARLEKDAVSELFQSLAKIPLRLFDAESIIRDVKSANLKSIKQKDSALIVETLLSLFLPLIEAGKPIKVFLEDLLAAVDEAIESEALSLSQDEKAALADNLAVLLKVPSIGLSAKAHSVLYENERSLISSRLLSEVRPVFGLDEDAIGGAIILHTLRLEYFTNVAGESQEFYVHLDDQDLEDLIFKLNRARNKSEKIKEMLKASSTPLIDGEN